MIQVTRKYRFAASHRLTSPHLSESENVALYGKCHNPFGHGHNYELEVSVRGPLDERSGRAVDPVRLDRIVAEQVVNPFDQHDLNSEVEVFQRAGARTVKVDGASHFLPMERPDLAREAIFEMATA